MTNLGLIVGIDVGGTFTDLIVVNPKNGDIQVGKVPSSPHSEGASVATGLKTLSIRAPKVQRLVHGTTVGTNALIERKGSKTAILTTHGFRDVIEIGRTKRMIPSLFNPFFVRPQPLVSRSHRYEIRERILHDGSVMTPVTTENILDINNESPEADLSIAHVFRAIRAP